MFDLTNEDFVEGIDPSDSFHTVMQHMNSLHGTGRVVSITWRTEPLKPGHRAGMAVCQLQYGMSARVFTVYTEPGRYVLRFAGRQKRVVSDYFDD